MTVMMTYVNKSHCIEKETAHKYFGVSTLCSKNVTIDGFSHLKWRKLLVSWLNLCFFSTLYGLQQGFQTFLAHRPHIIFGRVGVDL